MGKNASSLFVFCISIVDVYMTRYGSSKSGKSGSLNGCKEWKSGSKDGQIAAVTGDELGQMEIRVLFSE